MAGSMKDIKLRIKSVESTMQITKAMELVASSKMRRAKERVEHSRPYFETLYESLTKIAAADPRARNPYLRRDDIKRTLLVVIAGDRGLAGGYNANVFKQADAAEGPVTVLPIGKRSAEYFAHHGAGLFTPEVLMAADVSVSECFTLSHQITEGFLKGEYDAVKLCYTRFDSMMTQTATTLEVLPLTIEPTEAQKAEARRSQILYKPSCEEVFGAIIPEYVAGVLYGAVCDARLRQTVVNRSACGDFDAVGADMAGDGLEYDTQLLAPDAFSALYQHWLCAQMDLALGETARAVDELQMYSDYCQEFAAWMRQKYPPAGGVQWRY